MYVRARLDVWIEVMGETKYSAARKTVSEATAPYDLDITQLIQPPEIIEIITDKAYYQMCEDARAAEAYQG